MRILSKLLTFIALVITSNAVAENGQLKIPALLPLTGPAASVGRDLQNGIKLALRDLEQHGAPAVQVVFEDEKGMNAAAVSAWQKITLSADLAAVICFGSAIGNTLAPLAEEKRLPLVAIGASDRHVVQGRHFAFTHWVAPEKEAELIAHEVLRRNYLRVAVAANEQDGLLAIRRAAFSALEKQGGSARIQLNDTFPLGERDFKTYLTRARGRNVDAFFLLLYPEELGLFARQAREASLGTPLFGAELFEDTNAQAVSGGVLRGQWYVSAADLPADFVARFEREFGYRPPSWSGNAYDVIKILNEGAQTGKKGAVLAEYLRTLKDFHGALGVYSATGDNRFDLPAAVKIVPGAD
jgi:branched-chain amino acid transport system substrate-binding protein